MPRSYPSDGSLTPVMSRSEGSSQPPQIPSPNSFENRRNNPDFMNNLFSFPTPPPDKPTEQELDYRQPYSALPSSALGYYNGPHYPPQSPVLSIAPQGASNSIHPNPGNLQEEENPFFEEGSLLSSLFGNFSHQNRPSHNPPPANIPREQPIRPNSRQPDNSLLTFFWGAPTKPQNQKAQLPPPIHRASQQAHQPPKPPQQEPRATRKTPKNDGNFFESFLNIFNQNEQRQNNAHDDRHPRMVANQGLPRQTTNIPKNSTPQSNNVSPLDFFFGGLGAGKAPTSKAPKPKPTPHPTSVTKTNRDLPQTEI